MKKDYTTPSMVITSFSNEVVIMASAVMTKAPSSQAAADFKTLDLNSTSGKWNS